MLSAVGLALLLPGHGAPPAPRSVLVYILDDVADADLSPAVTPNILALAAHGTRFVNAYANPICDPTRHALYTGKWNVSGSGSPCGPPAEEALPLEAQTLMDLWPGTSALFGKWHCGGNPLGGPWEQAPLVHGFDLWRGTPANVRNCGGGGFSEWIYSDGATSEVLEVYNPPFIRDELQDWLASTSGRRLAVWSTALCHDPIHRPPSAELPPGWPVFMPTIRARWESMLASADLHLGQVLAGLDPDTIVIVVGDNGTQPLAAPDPTRAKATTFERGIHVPLIVAGPGIPVGHVSTKLVHVVDLLPTILELAGTRAPAGLDGIPLFSAAQHDWILSGSVVGPTDGTDVCARSLRYKLRRENGVESFHDLYQDPDELVDVIAEPVYRKKVAQARTWLDARLAELE